MSRDVDPHFLKAMREKLEHGKRKGRRDWDRGSWTVSSDWLENRLLAEVRELLVAIQSDNAEAILSEAADVANFAMFIADYHK